MAGRIALSVMLFLTLVVLHCSDRSSEMTVRWVGQSADTVGYKVERHEGEDGAFREIGTTPPEVTSFTDDGVVSGKMYCYRIGAVQPSGEIAYLEQTCRRTDPDSSQGDWAPQR